MANARMVDLDVFVFAHAESVLSSILKNYVLGLKVHHVVSVGTHCNYRSE
jgi:hypothetical protein